MVKKIVAYFVGGVALVTPFAIIFWVFHSIYKWIISYYDLEHALIGIFLMLISMIVIGYLASSFVGARAVEIFESILQKTPLLGPLYKTTKDVTGAFVGAENKFSEPVLVQFPGDIHKIGFITNQNIIKLRTDRQSENSNSLYSVYVPLSFSMSGDLFLVPANHLKPIDMKAKDVMQMIISGGLLR